MTGKIPLTSPLDVDDFTLKLINHELESCSAEQRVGWTLEHMPGAHVVSSSFGIQSAVMLHLMNRLQPGIPVILIDTGYLFAETYRFIDKLCEKLDLNLHVFNPQLSAAWHEARHGRLWLEGKSGIEHYNRIHKIEPMERALDSLSAGTWYAGLRREQASTRHGLPILRIQQDRFKIHPLVDWHKRDIHRYLKQHGLPYHPLWEKGYQSVGDHHSSRPLEPGVSEEQTRFFGLVRECGLHC